MGTMRVAIDRRIHSAGMLDRLVGSYVSESDIAPGRAMGRRPKLGGLPHESASHTAFGIC